MNRFLALGVVAWQLGCGPFRGAEPAVAAGGAQQRFLAAVDAGRFETVNGIAIGEDYRSVLVTVWVPNADEKQAAIAVYRRTATDYGAPELLFARHPYSDYQPILVGDSLLLFTSTRPIDGAGVSARQNVWSARKGVGGVWGTPAPVRGLESGAWDGHAFLLGEDKIVFASDRAGGSGMVDFYEADFASGRASNIVNASALNSPDSDNDGFFHARSRTLVFSRYSAARRDIDLFASRRNGQRWETPVPLAAVNTDRWEFSPSLTADGCHLLYRRGEDPRLRRVAAAQAGLPEACESTSP